MESLNLKWLIAHEPKYLFYRVAEDFKNIVNKHSKSLNIDIEILTDDEFNTKYSPTEPANRHNLWKLLKEGSIQIAQMEISSLARQCNREMQMLDMPYLFEDHDHVADVLEGSVGQYLLNNFDDESKIKGLAFTYSGGFRLLPLSQRVSSLNEIIGSSMRSGMSTIAQDTITQLGFKPVPTEITDASSTVQSGKAIGAEYVAQRLLPDQCDEWINTIIDTKHSLFLTSIIVNVDWWNNLDQQVKDIFTLAAFEAARNERELSISDGEKSLDKLKQSGVKIIDLTEAELDVLREKTKPVYDKYSDRFPKLQEIKNAGNK